MYTDKEKDYIRKKLKKVRRRSAPAIQVHKVRNRKKRKHVRQELNQYKGSFKGFKDGYSE